MRQVEPCERVRIDRRPEVGERHAKREMRSRRREEIAPVERPRDRLERVLRIRELVRLLDPTELLGGRNQKAVVGPDVDATFTVAQGEGAPCAADARVDDSKMDTKRHVGERVRERQRAREDLPRRNTVGDVDDLDLRGDLLHHAVAGADEVVLETEVRQEGDERHGA